MTIIVNCAPRVKHYYKYERQNSGMIHPIIGETLDNAERLSYTLLIGIDNFKQATYYKLEDGGYLIDIETDSGKFVAINRDADGASILYDYIDRFDEIQHNKEAFEKKWRIVDYDDLGQPITIREIDGLGNPTTWALGAPGAAIGFVGGMVLGYYIIDQQEEPSNDRILAMASGMAGGCLFALPGVFFGRKIDKEKGLEAIKKARLPRFVEQ